MSFDHMAGCGVLDAPPEPVIGPRFARTRRFQTGGHPAEQANGRRRMAN